MRNIPELSAFGAFRAVHPMDGGRLATVWRVEDSLGRAFVARRTARTEPQLRWVLTVQRLARQAGFRVAPFRAASSGALGPGGWTLEPMLEGRGAGLREMASLLPRIAEFHALGQGMKQRPGFVSSLDLLSGEIGGDVDLGGLPPKLVAACRAAWAPFTGQAETSVHGDLGPGNVLLGPGGPALIDWDEARLDLPLHDLAACTTLPEAEARAQMAFEMAVCWRKDPAYARTLAQHLQQGFQADESARVEGG